MLPLAVHITNFRHFDVDLKYIAEYAKVHGINYLEIGALEGHCMCSQRGTCPVISLDDDPIEIVRLLDDYGLSICQLDCTYAMNTYYGLRFSLPYMIKAIRFSSAIGCPRIDVTDGHYSVPGMSDGEVLRVIERNLAEALVVAEDYGVNINIETHGIYSTNPDHLCHILGSTDSPRLGLCFDMGNVYIAGRDPVRFLRNFIEKVDHIHVKDVAPELARAARGKSTGISGSAASIGEGVNADNILGCLRVLHEMSWEGILTPEAEGEERVTRSIEWIRKHLDQ